MTRLNKYFKLMCLTEEAGALRKELGVSAPNALLYRKRRSVLEQPVVVVEADGVGGAWTSIVEGDYPFDYLALYEKHFRREAEAVRAAKDVAEMDADPETVL